MWAVPELFAGHAEYQGLPPVTPRCALGCSDGGWCGQEAAGGADEQGKLGALRQG